MAETYTIKEVAEKFDLTVSTIRFMTKRACCHLLRRMNPVIGS